MFLQQLLDEISLTHRVVVSVRIEAGRGTFVLPVGADGGVVVQRQAVHHAARAAHQRFGPFIVGRFRAGAGAARDFVQAVIAVVVKVGLIAAVFVGVVVDGHVAAAAPVLVAHAEVLDVPRALLAVCLAQVAHGRLAV